MTSHIKRGDIVDVWDDRDPVERLVVHFSCAHVVILEDGSYCQPPFDRIRVVPGVKWDFDRMEEVTDG